MGKATVVSPGVVGGSRRGGFRQIILNCQKDLPDCTDVKPKPIAPAHVVMGQHIPTIHLGGVFKVFP